MAVTENDNVLGPVGGNVGCCSNCEKQYGGPSDPAILLLSIEPKAPDNYVKTAKTWVVQVSSNRWPGY